MVVMYVNKYMKNKKFLHELKVLYLKDCKNGFSTIRQFITSTGQESEFPYVIRNSARYTLA